jgi:menaquinol-cytochrome c reductase iron-sulfur subunit
LIIQVLGAAMAAAIAAPASLYLLMKPKSSGGEDLVEIADLSELAEGSPQEIVYYRTRVDGWKRTREKTTAWVVKTGQSNAIAFNPQCPHLGCIYHWEDQGQNFACPCHASAFSKDGKVVAGPAPRPLDRFDSRVEGGKLLVSSRVLRS